METNQIYGFDRFRISLKQQKLWLGSRLVPLTPKVFQTLSCLIEHSDRIVSKDELLASVWPDRVVEESNLMQNISVLRRALGESTSGAKYIATFPGRGYQFQGHLRVVSAGTDDETETTEFEPADLAPSERNETSGLPGPAETTTPLAEPASTRPAAPAPAARPQPRGTEIRRKREVRLGLGLLVIILAAAGWMTWTRSAGSTRRHEWQATNDTTISRMPGAQYQPVWSRQGEKLAFIHVDREAGARVFIQRTDALTPQMLMELPSRTASVAWSPDGRRLAYLSFTNQAAEIRIRNMDTGSDRAVAPIFRHRYGLTCRFLDWSPDGQFLAIADKTQEDHAFSIFLLSLADGRRIQLTYPSMDIIGDVQPRFSPDGGRLLFVRIKYQFEYDVYSIPLVGGEARQLTNDARLIGEVDWLPDGQHALISSERDDVFRLWLLDLTQPKIPTPQPVTGVSSDASLSFSISKRGLIAYSDYQPNLDIWSVDLKPNPGGLQWRPLIETAAPDFTPQFSTDGKQISFRSRGQRLWFADASGGHARQVGNFSRAGYGGWSPSGDYVFPLLPQSGIYVAHSGAMPAIRRFGAVDGGHPSFSTDGRWIYTHRNFRVFRTPAAGGKTESLTDRGGFPLLESPDGQYLYFARGRMDSAIWRLKLSTREPEPVVDDLMPGYWGCWTLHGDSIYYLTERQDGAWISRRDLGQKRSMPVGKFEGELPPIGTALFSASPAEDRMLTVRAGAASAVLKQATLTAQLQ